MAGGLSPSRIRSARRRRPIHPRVSRPLARDDDVGDSRAGDHQRNALALGDEADVALRDRHRLRPRQGQTLGERAAALRVLKREAARAHLRLRHAAAAQLSMAALGDPGDDRGARRQFHRHVQRQDGDGQRPRGDRHERARTADGLCRARRHRRGAAHRALRCAARLGGGLPGQSADPSARHVRHDGFPSRRAGLGREVARHPPRFQEPDRRRRGKHRMVGVARRRPAREARGSVGRDGHRFDRDGGAPPAGAHAGVDRLGHQPHERLSRLRGAGRTTSIRSRSCARSRR